MRVNSLIRTEWGDAMSLAFLLLIADDVAGSPVEQCTGMDAPHRFVLALTAAATLHLIKSLRGHGGSTPSPS